MVARGRRSEILYVRSALVEDRDWLGTYVRVIIRLRASSFPRILPRLQGGTDRGFRVLVRAMGPARHVVVVVVVFELGEGEVGLSAGACVEVKESRTYAHDPSSPSIPVLDETKGLYIWERSFSAPK